MAAAVRRGNGYRMEKEKKEIICDKCGFDILNMGMEIKEQILAEDEDGNPVIERFFDCQNCKKHYTVTVIDRKMRLMIQNRQMLQKRIARKLKDGAKISSLEIEMKKERELQIALINRANMLKEKYLRRE